MKLTMEEIFERATEYLDNETAYLIVDVPEWMYAENDRKLTGMLRRIKAAKADDDFDTYYYEHSYYSMR